MSDEDTITDTSGIADLRKQYEAQKKVNADQAALIAEFQSKQRATSVAEILKAKGLPASAAKLYTGEDVSEDAVGNWITEFADVFNTQAAAGNDANSANAANAQRVSDASFGNVDATSNRPAGENIMGSPEEIERAIRTLPMEELEKLGYMPKRGTLFNPNR